MRSLFVAAAVLMGLITAGCSSQGPVENPSSTATPQQAPTIALAATTQATISATNTRTGASDASVTPATPRASGSRTPAPVPTREDGLPVPAGARETKNVPDVVRTFLQTQLKGQRRIGQPIGYLVSRPVDDVLPQYTSDLQAQGWETVPLTGNLPDNVKLIIAQKDIRAIVVFTTETNGDTLVYIVTTQK